MHKVRRRKGYDIRFGDHTRKFSRLRKHDVPQVLRRVILSEGRPRGVEEGIESSRVCETCSRRALTGPPSATAWRLPRAAISRLSHYLARQ